MVEDVCSLPGDGQNHLFLPSPLAPHVLPNNVQVRRSQRLECLVTYITGVNPLLCALPPPPLIPSGKNMNSLTNLSLISSGHPVTLIHSLIYI